MTYKLQCLSPVKSDWLHRWSYVDDPLIHECVKGPLKAPLIAVPVPVVAEDNEKAKDCDCAKNIRECYGKTGIPDTQEEYLILSREGKGVAAQFPKHDLDITHHLNQNYHLYLGQGIPDPWRKWMYVDVGQNDHADLRKDFKDYFNKIRSGPGTGMYRTEVVKCPNCDRRLVILCVNRSDLEEANPRTTPPPATLRDACVETERPPPEPCRCKVDKACNFRSHQRDKQRYCQCRKHRDVGLIQEDLLTHLATCPTAVTLLKYLQNQAQTTREEKPPLKEKAYEPAPEPAPVTCPPAQDKSGCNRFEVKLTCGKCEKRPRRKPERCSSEEKPDHRRRPKYRACLCNHRNKCHCNDNSDHTCSCSNYKHSHHCYPDATIPVRLQLVNSASPRHFACGKIYDKDLSQLLNLFDCDNDLRRKKPSAEPNTQLLDDPLYRRPRAKPKIPTESLDRTLRGLNREHLYDSADWKNNEFLRQRTAVTSSVFDMGPSTSGKPGSRLRGYSFDEHGTMRNLVKRQRRNNQFRKQLRYYMAISRNELNRGVSSSSSLSAKPVVDERRRSTVDNGKRPAPIPVRIISPRRGRQPRLRNLLGQDQNDEEDDTP